MSVTTTLDTEANLITWAAEGDLSYEEARDAYVGVFSHPDFKPGMHALCDARDARIKLSITEIGQLIDVMQGFQDRRGSGYRVAILVAGSPDFGLSTMFEMQTYSFPFDMKVFRSSTEATAWLRGE